MSADAVSRIHDSTDEDPSFEMGQIFQLVAPRVRAYYQGAKLGEMLFDSDYLVRFLAVPILPRNPPEVAQSTPAQTRNDRRATQIASRGSAKDIQMDKADGEVLAGSSQRRKKAKIQGGEGSTEIDRSVTFSDLPCELHRLIFTCIERIDDIICLGLTNQYFWSIGRERMHNYYASFLGRGARTNIVCVGEYVLPNDYPPDLFSAEELDVLRQKTIDDVPFTLYHFTSDSISDEEREVSIFLESDDLAIRLSLLHDPAFASIRSEIYVEEETYLPEDQPWILRNLTTKQFVRSEAIALKPEFIHGPIISILGFGEIVMSRICWSSSSSVSMVDTTNISRGVWAGHCFDITTLSRHEDETNGIGWSDVSDEVAREIAGIYESNFGANWREQAIEEYSKRGRL